ncbi:hypothetical protein ACE1AT_17410 [Pelatocladus sp. BLCC-F211]|uniref:hypothetical protein n=1 Tax=Pelatocladus sp. BLCC-F211 TaxID=3342752 RepID=UPI0035BB4AA5
MASVKLKVIFVTSVINFYKYLQTLIVIFQIENGHPNWQYEPPTAADCYRYVLRNRAVHLALTAPKTRQQLEENLSVLHAPPLSSQEVAQWHSYGDLVYGTGQDAFDTQWV